MWLEERHNLGCKADLRVILDVRRQRFNYERDLTNGEAAIPTQGRRKFVADHDKVLVEAKAILNHLINAGVDTKSVKVLQLYGVEAYIYELRLAANGLYIASLAATLQIPVTGSKIDYVEAMYKDLTSFKVKSSLPMWAGLHTLRLYSCYGIGRHTGTCCCDCRADPTS